MPNPKLIFLLSIFFPFSFFNVGFAGEENPFTPKAYLLRYWNKEITNQSPKPNFILNKISPLNAVDSATFSKLATQNSISDNLPSFCSTAKLLCFPDLTASLDKYEKNVNFASYLNKNFTNYGTNRAGGLDSFKNYSDGDNIPVDSFRRYSRSSVGHGDSFNNYAPDSNVVDQSFNTYGTAATGGTGEFKNYNRFVNVPNLKFTTYSASGNGRKQIFSSYTDEANAGGESFASYGSNGNGAANSFSSYGKDSNVIGSSFSGYGETANAANNSFTSYGSDGNNPQNNFKNYAAGGNSATDTFANYRDQSNVGDDTFQSYAKKSSSAKENFVNYGQSFNDGTDKFSGYGSDGSGNQVGFKIYGVNSTFKDYAKKGATFSRYMNDSSLTTMADSGSGKTVNRDSGIGKSVNKWVVEPGKFFREKMLKTGTLIPMPDIGDKMPKRSFLPRTISSKLPFSTSKISELKEIFHASEDSTMARILADTLSECERSPSRGETKRCVGSVEDMIDFATSVLGRNVVVRSTENTIGSNQNVMIGSVRGINGGRVTKSVSCHQSLYPYMLYYCHSVPKVRVYEADLLDPKSKTKINHGIAVCHVDTSDWSSGHGAFVALGSGPGKIEVCHWIFENDMNWAIAD